MSDLLSLAAAKLAESGLGTKSLEQLGLTALERAETESLGHAKLKALRIDYHDRHGEPIDFYRLRYLEQPAMFPGQKPIRYTQPANSGVHAFFPLDPRWDDVNTTPLEPIFITEGEFKAMCACENGFLTIGLGGVYNWQSAPAQVDFLPELAEINWANRETYLVFDSDSVRNPQVQSALERLARELLARAAVVKIIALPDLPDKTKTGLDDYLVSEGAVKFGELVEHAVQPGIGRQLHELNSRFCFINEGGMVVDMTHQSISNIVMFAMVHQNIRSVVFNTHPTTGRVVRKEIRAVNAWLEWQGRLTRQRVTYKPGQPTLLSDAYNRWRGWGVEPAPGDITPWNELLDYLFTGMGAEAKKEWFEKWCAYPLQYPGTKLFTSAVVWGTYQGTGKSMLGYTLGKIYGSNFEEITQTDLQGSFNEWAVGKQFIMGEEITGSDKRQHADQLKKMVTQKWLRVNQKYVTPYSIPDCINYLFTSNHPDAFFLEDRDRRFFVHEVKVPANTTDFYSDYDLWLHGCGPSALFHHLLDLDVSDFNPQGSAPFTDDKTMMIADSKSDVAGWVMALREAPDAVLRVGEILIPGDLFSARQLRDLYDPDQKSRATANGISREMRRAGFRMAHEGKLIPINGRPERFFIVRNLEKWISASPSECRKHIEETKSVVQPSTSKY